MLARIRENKTAKPRQHANIGRNGPKSGRTITVLALACDCQQFANVGEVARPGIRAGVLAVPGEGMTVAVLGSRIYQPVTDVDAAIADLPPDATVCGIGEAPVAVRASDAAKARGLTAGRKPLESSRRTLLELAEAGADVLLFVARDPETKQPTSGVAGIQLLLTEKGVPFRVVSCDLPGRICQLITDLDAAVEKALATVQQPRRQIVLNQRALSLAARVADERDAYDRKLTEAFPFRLGDAEMDARYLRMLKSYESLCVALESAKRILTPKAVAA